MMRRYYQGLSNDLLDEEIETLKQQLADAEEIRSKRKGIEMFKCCECGKTDPDDDVIFEHLVNDHRYPDEDAAYGTERIYV